MAASRARVVCAWVLSVLLALMFFAAGLPKLLMVQAWVQKFVHWGYPGWFLPVIGSFEVAGATLLLIPKLVRYGALLLAAVMLGAAYTHIRGSEGLQVLRPFICLVCLGLLVWLRTVAGRRGGEEPA